MLYVDRLGLMLKCLRSLPFRSTRMKTFPLMIMRMVVRQRETVQRGMRLGGVEDASCFPNTLLVTHIHPERSLLTSSQSSHPCFNVTGLQPTVFLLSQQNLQNMLRNSERNCGITKRKNMLKLIFSESPEFPWKGFPPDRNCCQQRKLCHENISAIQSW